MNTNMKLIAEQALTYAYEICRKENRPGGDGDHIWVSLVMGKLSELIVKECAALVDTSWDLSGNMIREHFGIEK